MIDVESEFAAVPKFTDAARSTKELQLIPSIFGGYDKDSVHRALKNMDAYYMAASARYRDALADAFERTHRELLAEVVLLEAENESMRQALDDETEF